MKTALSDLTSTKTGVHKHQTTSIVVEIKLKDIPGYERCLYKHHDSKNDRILSSQHRNRSPQALHSIYSCGNWALGHSWLWKTAVQPPGRWEWLYLIFPALTQESTRIVQPLHLSKPNFSTFLVQKDSCTTSMTVKTALTDLSSTETWVHKHQITSTIVEIELYDILGSEKRLSKLPDGKNDCIWSCYHWIRSPQASHHLYICGSRALGYFWL